MAESEKELKSLLMTLKEQSEKSGLKLNNQKMKIMAPGPITSWQIDGEMNGNSDRLCFLRLHNHLDDDCSHGFKTRAHWKKSYDKARQHIKKQTSLC